MDCASCGALGAVQQSRCAAHVAQHKACCADMAPTELPWSSCTRVAAAESHGDAAAGGGESRTSSGGRVPAMEQLANVRSRRGIMLVLANDAGELCGFWNQICGQKTLFRCRPLAFGALAAKAGTAHVELSVAAYALDCESRRGRTGAVCSAMNKR